METALRSSKKIALFGLAATLLTASASQAAVTIYTSQATFNAATTAQGVDTFAGFSITSTTPSPINRSAGSYTYTAACSTSTFFGAGTTGDPWLSSNIATDTITFNNFSGGAQAAGGNFFASNVSGAFTAGDVQLTATDASGIVSQAVIGATTSSFVGFVSDGALTSVTLASVQPTTGFLWPTADNFTLAMRANIPEPTTLGALAAAGAMVLRRRR